MLYKFRNWTDRVCTRIADWWLRDLTSLEFCYDLEYAHQLISKLEVRIAELEESNENLIIQRMEVRKLVEQLVRHFPKQANDN